MFNGISPVQQRGLQQKIHPGMRVQSSSVNTSPMYNFEGLQIILEGMPNKDGIFIYYLKKLLLSILQGVGDSFQWLFSNAWFVCMIIADWIFWHHQHVQDDLQPAIFLRQVQKNFAMERACALYLTISSTTQVSGGHFHGFYLRLDQLFLD